MFELALKARLPLVAAYSSDLIHFQAIVQEITGKTPQAFPRGVAVTNLKIAPGALYYAVGLTLEDGTAPTLYDRLAELESTLIGLNMDVLPDEFFRAGDVPVPKKLLVESLGEVYEPGKIEEVMPAFGGLNLREVQEVCRLTEARDGSLTARGVMRTRRGAYAAVRGIAPVDTSLTAYVPHAEFFAYIQGEAAFFLSAADQRLIPRGVLLDGEPGVGKTSASKFVANQWGVPLYRLDVGAIKGKWVGESEHNLTRALSQIDREEPAILLLDEVEKLFASRSSEEVSASLLSQMLWWLQERTSRVFVVMTTNDAGSIPGELVREGRIDERFTFEGLTYHEGEKFLLAMLQDFNGFEDFQPGNKEWAQLVAIYNQKGLLAAGEKAKVTRVSQAAVAKLARQIVKQNLES